MGAKNSEKKHSKKAGRIRLSEAEPCICGNRLICIAPQAGQLTADSCICFPQPLQKTMAISFKPFLHRWQNAHHLAHMLPGNSFDKASLGPPVYDWKIETI